MKNKILLLFLIVACFIPSVVAYASYNNTQNAPIDDKTAAGITICDVNGKEFSYTRTAEGDTADNLINFFMNVRKNATALASLPETLQSEDYYRVVISSNVREETYQFYFSSDPTTNYFRDPNGQTYKMNEADAEVFIKTEYAESIYEMSAMPVLIELAAPFVKVGGSFIAYKSGEMEEIKEAESAYKILGAKCEEIIPYSLPEGYGERLLAVVKKVKPTPPKYPRGQGKERKQPL